MAPAIILTELLLPGRLGKINRLTRPFQALGSFAEPLLGLRAYSTAENVVCLQYHSSDELIALACT